MTFKLREPGDLRPLSTDDHLAVRPPGRRA